MQLLIYVVLLAVGVFRVKGVPAGGSIGREVKTLQELFLNCHVTIKDDGTVVGIHLPSKDYNVRCLKSALCTFNARSFTQALGLEEVYLDYIMYSENEDMNVDISNIFTRLIVEQGRDVINYETAITFLERLGLSDVLSDDNTCAALKSISYLIWRIKQDNTAGRPIDYETLRSESLELFNMDLNRISDPKCGGIDKLIQEVSVGDEGAAEEIVSFVASSFKGVLELNSVDLIIKLELVQGAIKGIDRAAKALRDVGGAAPPSRL